MTFFILLMPWFWLTWIFLMGSLLRLRSKLLQVLGFSILIIKASLSDAEDVSKLGMLLLSVIQRKRKDLSLGGMMLLLNTTLFGRRPLRFLHGIPRVVLLVFLVDGSSQSFGLFVPSVDRDSASVAASANDVSERVPIGLEQNTGQNVVFWIFLVWLCWICGG